MNPTICVQLPERSAHRREAVEAALRMYFPNVHTSVQTAPVDEPYLLTTTRSYFEMACEVVEKALDPWPSPVSPDDLAEAVATVVARAQQRVGPDSVGAQQYWRPGEPQLFEEMTLDGLIQLYQEELLDVVNYATMLTIRLDRMRDELARRGIQ